MRDKKTPTDFGSMLKVIHTMLITVSTDSDSQFTAVFIAPLVTQSRPGGRPGRRRPHRRRHGGPHVARLRPAADAARGGFAGIGRADADGRAESVWKT